MKKRNQVPPLPTLNLPTAEENLQRALHAARKVFRGPDAYRTAVEELEDRRWQETSDAHARIVRWAIDAHNSLEAKE